MKVKRFHIVLFAVFALILQGCYDEPVANFDYTYTSNVAPATVNFNNFSTEADEYQWDFGDGQRSTDMSPVHTYEQHGTFTISLTAKGKGGENMMSKSINILRPTTYVIKNSTTQITLYNLTSYYWDPVGETEYDVVEHGDLSSGFQTDEVITERPSIEAAFQFIPEADCTWYYVFVEPVFPIIPNSLNVMDINDNTDVWWFENKPADPFDRQKSVRKYSKKLAN